MRAFVLPLVVAATLVAGLPSRPLAAQSVTLRIQVIEAGAFTTADPAISDVQEALADLFRFEGYRLAAESVLRVGGGEFSQTLAATNGQVYMITGEAAEFMEYPPKGWEHERQLRVSDLTLWVGDRSPVLRTSLSLPLGQTAVVGSARPAADGSTLILVVRPEAP